MDVATLKLLLQLLPRLPMIARVAIFHMLQMSPSSKYVDLKTELTVTLIRSFLTPSKPMSISDTQSLLNRDPGIKGRIWVAKYTAPAPKETSIRDVVIRAIENMRQPASDGSPLPPLKNVDWSDVVPVEAEWTGYRAGATPQSILPSITEAEKYAEMMKEVKNRTTVLYLHGGAYYLMDPFTYRPTTKLLTKLIGGRCYSVRYRLAPQNPFPAALIDALLSYLNLLYPPLGAFHEAVKPEDIVFSGDSAGGNLCMALTQLLLEFKRTNTKIQWFGQEVDVPLPAGLALSSPWLDLTHSSPSCKTNAEFDYLPMLQGLDKVPRPSCAAWPANPPRKVLYCADALITHPLVTLLTARSWEGCPPVYISCGWELLADEDKYMAAKLHADKVPVVFEEYEGMPHCFPMIFKGSPMSVRCLDAWTEFTTDVVEKGPGSVESAFRTIKARTMKEMDIDPSGLSPYTEEELRERLRGLRRERAPPAQATGDVAAKL
ncbi:hypothetical protein VMCG_03025 [Cytospora schulzeri]|uniref:Alpha/beta hydrolase fold-3 domain-containing protein n=1 Tax=Cytospora schulzeri TaxID=448051 RepID=A0A423WY93_9PEZI|nr:hypothetical protein VMCG_03025 [Valsa malicola]